MESVPVLPRSLDVMPQGKDYSVIASLPKNSVSLAARAEEAGVDALMMNIDGEEGASPNHYGSFDLHDVYIKDVISTVRIPCGIFIGGGRQLSEEYWERVMTAPFSFVEMYAHHMPSFVLADGRVQKVVAIATGYIIEQVRQLSAMSQVEAVDVATVPAQSRGAPFSVLDYATLAVISSATTKPILLRTQKRLTRGDLSLVLSRGVKGLVVDPCILSGTDEAYKEELAGLSPRRGSSEA
jgi:hypothetical protein